MPEVLRPARDPLDVTLLVTTGTSLMCVAAAVDPLRAANRVSGRDLFRRRLVSRDGTPPVTTCGVPIAVDGRLDPATVGDVLVVLAGFDVAREAPRPLLATVRAAARRAALVVGIDSGAWVMAMAGLLDGRAATTHWEDLEDFPARFPRVGVRPDRWVVDGKFATTGGASPAFDFMLHVVRSRCGHGVALDVASVFGYDEVHAGSDPQPIVSLGRVRGHEPRVAEAIRLMEAALDAPRDVAGIAREIGLSSRRLEALFAATVGATPGRFYLDLRLAAARRLVVDTRLSLTDVSVRTGFASASSFARAFRRRYGQSARAVRGSTARG